MKKSRLKQDQDPPHQSTNTATDRIVKKAHTKSAAEVTAVVNTIKAHTRHPQNIAITIKTVTGNVPQCTKPRHQSIIIVALGRHERLAHLHPRQLLPLLHCRADLDPRPTHQIVIIATGIIETSPKVNTSIDNVTVQTRFTKVAEARPKQSLRAAPRPLAHRPRLMQRLQRQPLQAPLWLFPLRRRALAMTRRILPKCLDR